MFRDEFIGDLLQALPHPELDYDRWMMELDPKERNRRHHFGEPETVAFPAANKSVNADHALHTTGSDESEGVPLPVSSSRPEVSGGAVTPVPGNASSPSETPINEPLGMRFSQICTVPRRLFQVRVGMLAGWLPSPMGTEKRMVEKRTMGRMACFLFNTRT